MPTTTQTTPRPLKIPDGQLYYEVRGTGPLVVLVGAPMDAAAFAPLAELLATDHTVLTTDPRGINRSVLNDPDSDSTPQLRADDLARLISAQEVGPAVLFGSSGGAVSAVALIESHPEVVHTVVVHEPPLDQLLDDRDQLLAATEQMAVSHRAGDLRRAWTLFMTTANIHLPEHVFDMFVGEKDPQAAVDERYQFEHMLRGTVAHQPNLEALRAAPVRIVVGIGEQSTGQLCDRTSRALAAALDLEPTLFPGGHVGFAEDPSAFAARWREVLG